MKLQDVIDELVQIQAAHGNLHVCCERSNWNGEYLGYAPLAMPTVKSYSDKEFDITLPDNPTQFVLLEAKDK